MSYTIYYGTMSVKLSKDNKYIPMMLAGSNNVRDYNGRRARSWQNVSDRNGKLFFTPDEFMEETRHIIDTNEYLSDNRISGNGNMTPRKLINLSKKCLQNSISFVQAVDLLFYVFWYDKDDNCSLQKFFPKTEDELFSFVNAPENKNKSLYFSFYREDATKRLYDGLNVLKTMFKKESDGDFCFHGYFKYKDRQDREKNHFYVGKGNDGEPVIVNSFEQAFKFKTRPNCVQLSAIFAYLNDNKGYGNIFSAGIRTKEDEENGVINY